MREKFGIIRPNLRHRKRNGDFVECAGRLRERDVKETFEKGNEAGWLEDGGGSRTWGCPGGDIQGKAACVCEPGVQMDFEAGVLPEVSSAICV